MMKILLSAYACEPNRGSEPGNGWNWSYYLNKLGYQIWVLTHVEQKEKIEQTLALRSIPNLNFIYVDTPKWIKPYQKILRGDFSWQSQYLGWQWQAYQVAKKLDREHNFDLIHHVTYASITGGSWLWLLRKPFIFGPVGGGQVTPETFKQYFSTDWAKESLRSLIFKNLALFNFISRQTLSHASLVLAVNRDTYDLAYQLGADRVKLFLSAGLPQDYSPQEIPTRSTSQELRLLWVGGLIARKGLPLALEALAQVDSSVPFKMSILGDGYLRDDLVKWIQQFGLENKIDCCGRVSWQEVKNKYLNSDVFLFTSLRDTYGCQLLEAMAHALPIITLEHHGARDFVPDRAGLKIPVTNPNKTAKAIAQAIEYMYRNPQERLDMGKVGYEFAKTQTWPNKTLEMSEYYQKVLRESLS
jgi:glycosyltransferase involved in cell wall biosynthesis